MTGRLALIAVLCGSTGCMLEDVDFSGKSCPCDEGYVCVRAACVPAGIDAGGGVRRPDSGPPPMDAGPGDAGTPADAGPMPDAGPMLDAGPTVDAGDVETDAGPPDAGPADAGPPGACAAHAGALFCDDFESGDLSSWVPETIDGEAGVVSTRAHGGTSAARFATTAAGGTARAHADLAATAAEIHVRAWMYVPGTASEQLDVFYAYDESGYGAGYYLLTSRNSVGLWYGTDAGGEWMESSSGAWPRDTWFCARARYRVGVGNAHFELWIDDTRVVLDEAATLDIGPFRYFLTGISMRPSGTTEVFVDDVVIDTAPVACDE